MTDVDTVELNPQSEDELMLTTMDNPYNPKEDYPKWRQWDLDNGYHTEEYIARLIPLNVDVDDDLTLAMHVNQIVLDILNNDVINIYKLV